LHDEVVCFLVCGEHVLFVGLEQLADVRTQLGLVFERLFANGDGSS
jgi:hypothetical protein